MLPPIQDSWEPHSDKQWPAEGFESPGHPSIIPFNTLSPRVRLPPLQQPIQTEVTAVYSLIPGKDDSQVQLSSRESKVQKAAWN
jgi:hypothetical protein